MNNNATAIYEQIGESNLGDVVKHHPVIEELQVGDILDACDYLGTWHLSIVIDLDGKNKVIHFLPFKNQKRDEVFKIEDD